MQHVNRRATEPTNVCVCTITAGDTLLSILQHFFDVHHHRIRTNVLPPVRPLNDLIKIAVMRRGKVVIIMQSEVVIWCLQQEVCLLEGQRRTKSVTIQSGLNTT